MGSPPLILALNILLFAAQSCLPGNLHQSHMLLLMKLVVTSWRELPTYLKPLILKPQLKHQKPTLKSIQTIKLRKQISCSLQLSNKTDNYVAFKVKTTNLKKYCVRPNTGIVLPRSTCDVIE